MNFHNHINRKDFLRLAGLGSAASILAPSLAFQQAAKKFDIGATFILWGYSANNLEAALADISALGYSSFETFGNVIEEWENNRGGFSEVVEKHGVPIVSAFCMTDILNPDVMQEEVETLTRWARLLKQNGGTLVEYCPSSINRNGFDYRDHRTQMIEAMNTYAKAVTDEGLVCALHPHTGTPIETEEEVYFVMENVDTEYMKFGPDSGQLAKGGADPVKIFRDFMPLIEHVHLKDYEGGDNGWLGYAPLGEGTVDIEQILVMLEEGRDEMTGKIMFELDYDGRIDGRFNDYEAAKVSRDYLDELGYEFDA